MVNGFTFVKINYDIFCLCDENINIFIINFQHNPKCWTPKWQCVPNKRRNSKTNCINFDKSRSRYFSFNSTNLDATNYELQKMNM